MSKFMQRFYSIAILAIALSLSVICPGQAQVQVTRTWTAPQYSNWQNASYELRYSSKPWLLPDHPESCQVVQNMPAPEAPGTPQSVTFWVAPNSQYRYCIWTIGAGYYNADSVWCEGPYSQPSNLLDETSPPPVAPAAIGDLR